MQPRIKRSPTFLNFAVNPSTPTPDKDQNKKDLEKMGQQLDTTMTNENGVNELVKKLPTMLILTQGRTEPGLPLDKRLATGLDALIAPYNKENNTLKLESRSTAGFDASKKEGQEPDAPTRRLR
jgi:hypothetical protein